MFWFIPIEPLEERYTSQWIQSIRAHLQDRHIDHTTVVGEPLHGSTKGGQFLNWTSTIHYKASQIKALAGAFDRGEVNAGDVFFVADIWFPGIEAIAYMADLLGIDVRIYGINHAGPFDPTDLVRPLLYWGKYQEAAWYALFDAVFVGSMHLKTRIGWGLDFANLPLSLLSKIHVTGTIWEDSWTDIASDFPKSEHPIVVWPHRLSPDKNPAGFYSIVKVLHGRYPDVRWVITSGRMDQKYEPEHPAVEFMTLSKADYYGLLREATLLLSTAAHENFGLSIREATALDTPILCPTRACYPEMIQSADNLYDTIEEAVQKTEAALHSGVPVATLAPFGGFPKMLEIMEKGGGFK